MSSAAPALDNCFGGGGRDGGGAFPFTEPRVAAEGFGGGPSFREPRMAAEGLGGGAAEVSDALRTGGLFGFDGTDLLFPLGLGGTSDDELDPEPAGLSGTLTSSTSIDVELSVRVAAISLADDGFLATDGLAGGC